MYSKTRPSQSLTLGDQFSLLQETKDKVEHSVNSSQIFGITENFKGKYSEPNCDSASLKFICSYFCHGHRKFLFVIKQQAGIFLKGLMKTINNLSKPLQYSSRDSNQAHCFTKMQLLWTVEPAWPICN